MEYFTKLSSHIHGQMDLDAITIEPSNTKIISLGSDDLVIWRNLSNNEQNQLQLAINHGFNTIALHPLGNQFILGGQSKKVWQYDISSKKMSKVIYQSLGKILDLKYSPSGRYISIATDEQKTVVVDTQNNRKTKCRPGHSNGVINTFFGLTDQYIASIGQDCVVLIYELFPDKDPQQVYKTKFTHQKPPQKIHGCFTSIKNGLRIFLPGTIDLQIIQHLNNRWQIKKSNIAHSTIILLTQTINQQLLATSCARDFCIWMIQTQEKYVVLENFPIAKIIPIPNSFIAHRNDGFIYCYNRPLPHSSQHLDKNVIDSDFQIQSKVDQSINQIQQNIELEYNEKSLKPQLQQQQQLPYTSTKKRIADRIIKVYPQDQLNRSTNYFDDHRFLYMNLYGYIIQTRSIDQIQIIVQFNRPQDLKPKIKSLFKNKQLRYFSINQQVVCYASQTQFGIKIQKISSWEKQWFDIQGVALSSNWIAIANISQIKFLDLSGTEIKTICFDRPIIAMQAYQNLLAVVYHQGVPIYQSQLLTMKIFTINPYQILTISQCHVPLTLPIPGEKGFILKWFGFSMQGMLMSKDSCGIIRAYSLQSNQWTPIHIENINDQKKIWIIGFKQYCLHYWKTAQPEPTVKPRLPEKSSKLAISTLPENIQQLQNYPYILWQRYCLNHQIARFRLWSHHKSIRSTKHINYQLSKSIINQKQIHDRFLNLDVQLTSIVKFFLKNNQIQRAVNFTKSQIKSIQVGRNITDLFDQYGHRSQAIQLQYFYDEKQKQIEYQTLQQLSLKQLKAKVSISIHPHKTNPMNPKFKKNIKDNIPFNISSSQQSQNLSNMEDITHQPHLHEKNDDNFENPFLKKKPTDDHKQQIQQHIEKYGVKRKVEQKKKNIF